MKKLCPYGLSKMIAYEIIKEFRIAHNCQFVQQFYLIMSRLEQKSMY